MVKFSTFGLLALSLVVTSCAGFHGKRDVAQVQEKGGEVGNPISQVPIYQRTEIGIAITADLKKIKEIKVKKNTNIVEETRKLAEALPGGSTDVILGLEADTSLVLPSGLILKGMNLIGANAVAAGKIVFYQIKRKEQEMIVVSLVGSPYEFIVELGAPATQMVVPKNLDVESLFNGVVFDGQGNRLKATFIRKSYNNTHTTVIKFEDK